MQRMAMQLIPRAVRASCQRQALFTGSLESPKLCNFMIASGFAVAGTFGALQAHPSSCETEIRAPPKKPFDDLCKELPALKKDSETWKKELEKTASNCAISIFSAPTHIKDIRGRQYRVEIRSSPGQAKTLTPERIAEEMQDMNKRMKWDPNLSHGEFLHSNGAYEPDIVLFRTKAAAGGMISSREFVDARMQIRQDDGIVIVGKGWDQELGVSCGPGLTRAVNGPGVRAHIRREADGVICITLFQHTELGGSIPLWLLNATVADAHLKYAKSLLTALAIS